MKPVEVYLVRALEVDAPPDVQIIAVYNLLAVQVQQLRYLAEKQADQPVEQAGYTTQDYQMVATYLNTTTGLNFESHKQQVSIAEFTRLISILGSNHTAKKTGVRSLWHGLRDFKIIQQAYRAFSSA